MKNVAKILVLSVAFIWVAFTLTSCGNTPTVEYVSNGDGTCYVSKVTSDGIIPSSFEVEIPEKSPDGDTVVEIGESAFTKSKVSSVVLPKTIKTIADLAFYRCEYLKEINLPESLETIGFSAFVNCKLTEIVIPKNVDIIGSYAFNGCESLKNVEIKGASYISSCAFLGCEALETVILSDKLEFIGESAFENCTSLSEITIPENVYSIGIWAFQGCSELKSVEFENVHGWNLWEQNKWHEIPIENLRDKSIAARMLIMNQTEWKNSILEPKK